MKTTVASSLIASVEWNEETHQMIVHWCKGGQQAYENVPKEVYEEFVNAESVGKYYNQKIKGNAAYSNVPPVETEF